MEVKFLFSAVVLAGSDSKKLEETLKSLVAQDIGFEKNIQVILVHEGNSAHSKELCLEYQNRYVDNIVYDSRSHIGKNGARNAGIKYVSGKYVNFLDAGECWTSDSFQLVYKFFEKRGSTVDLVCAVQSVSKSGSRVINILEKYKSIQAPMSACFVKEEALCAHVFDEQLTWGGETAFVNSVVLDRHRYGVVAAARSFYYRNGKKGRTALRGKGKPKEWYLRMPLTDLGLIKQSVRIYDEVILYVQDAVLHELRPRLRDDPSHVLTAEEQDEYMLLLKEVLSYMDDDMICKADKMYVEYKMYALSLKYGCDIRDRLTYRRGNVYFRNIKLYSLQAKSLFSVDVLAVRDGMLHLSGRIWSPFADVLDLYFENDTGERFPIVSSPARFRKAVILGTEMIRVRGYEAVLPLEGVRGYRVYGQYEKRYPQPLYIRMGKFSHLSQKVKELYFTDGGYMIGCGEQSVLWVRRRHLFLHIGKELRLLCRCIRDHKYKIAVYRVLCHLVQPFLRKERWIVMERAQLAGDNAEHFYKYLKENGEKDIKSYFVISKDSPDYERMQQIGKVLPFRTFGHKFHVLLAKYIVSSQAEDNIYNPWDNDSIYIRDLYKYRYVFLQHGIVKDDLSEWLNKFNKNLRMFVTSAAPEYQSVLDGDYFYDSSVVKLTGLPRYDSLDREAVPEKTIVFMPTWRYALAGRVNNHTGKREYNPYFKYSSFFQFYQSLIKDDRILQALRANGYTGRVVLHTHHRVQIKDFQDNDTICLVRDGIDYQEEFQKNALLITDFSSVAFDFAYLKKPVIYAQFDRDTFFQGQVYDKGYFDYERDAFGPVCYDYEATVHTIIRYVENGCRLDKEYDERSSRFYRWFDHNNCRRVYEEIRSLD